jgi:hypothetical protein
MWFKAGAFAGLNTDAWLSNYAIGIGSTQFPSGTRLAAGAVQFTENDLAVVRNINSSGVVTATRFIGTATSLDIDGLTTIADPQSGDFIALYDISGLIVGKATIQNAALQGVQGLQGTQGTQGTQGLQGLQGTQGLQGLQGVQGTQGTQGLQGLQGVQGTQGTQGTQGQIGPIAGIDKQIIFNDSNTSAGATNFVYDKATGYVGVGTDNPQYQLDVDGDINFTGIFYENGSPFVASRWTAGSGTDIYRLSNVGIGTTAPTEDLDIAGNIRIRGALYDGLNDSGSSGQVLISTGTGLDWTNITDLPSIQTIVNELNITLTGIGASDEGVGIGTDFISINFIGTGVTAIANGKSLDVSFDQQVGPQGLQGTVGSQGVQGLQGTQGTQGLIGPVAGTNSQVIFNNNNVSAGATNFVYDAVNQRVGIGTTNPTAKLDVWGQSNLSGASLSGITTLGFFSDAFHLNRSVILAPNTKYYSVHKQLYVGAGHSLTIGAGATIILDRFNNLDDVTADSLIVTGNVGIGTTNPTEKLSITGNILINDTTTQGSFTATSATTSTVGIHSALSTSIYRSVEYTIQATQGSNFHATKILTIHDGSIAYNSEYGTIFNNESVSSFDVDVSDGNIRLLAIPASASTTNYIINFIAIKIY